jgi:hypothetical protein
MIELVSAKIGFQLLFYIYSINLVSSRQDVRKRPSSYVRNLDYSGCLPAYIIEQFREPARALPKHIWNKLKGNANTPKTGGNP